MSVSGPSAVCVSNLYQICVFFIRSKTKNSLALTELAEGSANCVVLSIGFAIATGLQKLAAAAAAVGNTDADTGTGSSSMV